MVVSKSTNNEFYCNWAFFYKLQAQMESTRSTWRTPHALITGSVQLNSPWSERGETLNARLAKGVLFLMKQISNSIFGEFHLKHGVMVLSTYEMSVTKEAITLTLNGKEAVTLYFSTSEELKEWTMHLWTICGRKLQDEFKESGDEVGKESSGKLFQIFHKDPAVNPDEMCLKRIKSKGEKCEKLKNEIFVCAIAHHTNLRGIIDIFEEKNEVLLVNFTPQKANLRDLAKDETKAGDDFIAHIISGGIFNGANDLARCNIALSTFQAESVLVDEVDESIKPVISDFSDCHLDADTVMLKESFHNIALELISVFPKKHEIVHRYLESALEDLRPICENITRHNKNP